MIRMWRLALVGLVLGAFGCSNDTVDDTDVNEDKLFGDYQVYYDEGGRDLRYYAQLRLGGASGTTIRLTAGRMEVAGQEMRLVDGEDLVINVTGTYYTLSQSTDSPPATHTFTWTRSDGSSYDNTLETQPAFSIAEPAAGATHTGGDLVVVLNGPALKAGESYRVSLDADNQAGEGQRGTLSERSDTGDRVVFPAADVALLPPGGVKVRARRVWQGTPQNGHAIEGGSLTSSRLAPEVAIQVQGAGS